MFKLFKKKENIESDYPQDNKQILLTKYVTELRSLGYSDEQIKQKFVEKNYPKEFMDWLMQLNTKQEVKQKMAREVEVEEETDELEEEEEETESEDDEDVELEDEEETKPQKLKPVKEAKEVKKVPVKAKQEETKALTLEDVTADLQTVAQMVDVLSQRLQAVEATLYRMRSA